MSQKLKCPHCKKEIELNDSLTEHIREDLKNEFTDKIKNLEEVLEKQKESSEKEFKEKLQDEKKKLWKVALEKAEEKQQLAVKNLEEELQEKKAALIKAEEQELEFLKMQRNLKEKERRLEIDLQRKLDNQRNEIEQLIRKTVIEEERMKMREKDKQLEMMRKQIEDLKQKSEQGSMQIQGEVQEEDLKRILKSAFLSDDIEDVPTGIQGADLVQTVKNQFNRKAGVILWESKNTKSFSNSWIKKLKDDRTKVNADICILITRTLPDEIDSFGLLSGVWVCSYKFALPLATTLRSQVLAVNQMKENMKGQDEKMNILMDYLTGPQFRSRFENIINAFTSMKEELEKEKRAMQRIWSRREKEIERMIDNSSGMYGDLQGIVGNKLSNIEQLELGAV